MVVPRLPHFPSRLVDNRSESGVEQRRLLLDNYFRAISAWPYYPTALIKFLNVRVPEEFILEKANQNLVSQNGNGPMAPSKEQIYSAGLFYTGDRLFTASVLKISYGGIHDSYASLNPRIPPAPLCKYFNEHSRPQISPKFSHPGAPLSENYNSNKINLQLLN